MYNVHAYDNMKAELQQEVATPVVHEIVLMWWWHYPVKQAILGRSDGRKKG